MTRRSLLFSRFLDDRDGNFGIIFAILAVPLLLAVGGSIDFTRAVNERADLQSAADSAVLAAASEYKEATQETTLTKSINAYLSGNGVSGAAVVGKPKVSSDKSELCIDVANSVATTFMKIANIESVPVEVRACAALPGVKQLEVALVVDVSSSMIEGKRFTPMQNAVTAFLQAFSSNEVVMEKTKISIVPFSSRVNIGLSNTDWLTSYSGSPVVPTRWTDPKGFYKSEDKLSYWIDGITPYVTTPTNFYWMGCIEPRADVEVKNEGAIGTYGTSEAPPSASPFVAMDANPDSGQSFCPPPITPLTADLSYLKDVVKNLTSEGSTRLDAGVVAGWYTLSPKWKGVWGDKSSPAAYSDPVHKVMVFMTDGEMNTKFIIKKPGDKFDWLCSKTQSNSCHKLATSAMQTTCSAMRTAGIEIFTLSYSGDADVVNIRNCATSPEHFFTASPATIKTVYETIAAAIRGNTVRLTR